MTDPARLPGDPLLTFCPSCPDWQVSCWSDDEKERKERLHAEQQCPDRKPPTVSAVTALVAGDPSHASEVEAVEYAYRRAATLNGGYVTANDARPLIPPWVTRPVIGAAVTRMKASGVLVDTDESEPSTDTKGRNTNKNAPRYFVPEWARAGIEGVRTG